MRKFRIEVLERTKGKRGGENAVTGFAEVELHYRR